MSNKFSGDANDSGLGTSFLRTIKKNLFSFLPRESQGGIYWKKVKHPCPSLHYMDPNSWSLFIILSSLLSTSTPTFAKEYPLLTPLAKFFQLKSYLLCRAFHDCTGLPNALAHETSSTVQTLDLFLIASFPNDCIYLSYIISNQKQKRKPKLWISTLRAQNYGRTKIPDSLLLCNPTTQKWPLASGTHSHWETLMGIIMGH